MALLQVVRVGDPVLRQVAAPVADPADPAIAALAQSMIETMEAEPGVGLAAPQVGQSLRLIVMRIVASRAEAMEEEQHRHMALVNPTVEPLGAEIELGWEGCLSVPDLRGVVPRASRVRYHGWLLDGSEVEGEAAGFQARILQHETDHLNGIVYLDRMQDMSTLGYDAEIVAAARAAQAASA